MSKVWSTKDILAMWPQAAGELKSFMNALERSSSLTASQLGMALQLAELEFQRLLVASSGAVKNYKPARNPNAIEPGNPECPLAVLRSHPDFPETLSPELEGVVVATNPAWPDATVDLVLQEFEPACHTDWKDFSQERTEDRDGRTAYVVYVRPGAKPVAVEK